MTGQDYSRPDVDVPGQFRYAGTAEKTAPLANWWKQIDDPALTEAIETALQNNHDLRIATARLQEYEASRIATAGPLWPQLGLLASDTRGRPGGNNPVTESYQAAFTLSWELDFWGRIRRLSEAAEADYLAQDAARHAVVITLVGSVATTYIQLRELDSRLDMAYRTLDARKASERLAQFRYAGGVISEMELKQTGSELQGTLVSVKQLEQAVAQKENELRLLLGLNPGPIRRGRTIDALTLPAVPSGLPSELLARRPDIRQAEQTLIAANARVGAARANLFPTVSLTGNQGSVSPQLSGLFNGPSRSWSFASSLSQPVFSGGSLLARIRISEAQREQALAEYRKAIQSAFRETEDALVALDKLAEQKASQLKLVEELRRYAYLADLRYKNGVTSHLEVLDSQRNLFSAEQGLAQAQSAALIASINLCKALGGDWSSAPGDSNVAKETGK
jgi:multidrug efflux system outer membrane protein